MPWRAAYGSGRAHRALTATFAPEMEGGEHSSRELTVSVKVPCQECGGLGYIQRVKAGKIVGDKSKKCRTCRGRGLIPDDLPISQLRELLK
jgi:DnaJ-class molecular chaperone